MIIYEFVYGRPPFNADTPVEIFANILSHRLDFDSDSDPPSPEVRDLIERLLCHDVKKRLGSHGAAEIRQHPFFADIKWDQLAATPALFIPKTANAEDTIYFDARGATVEQLEQSLLGPGLQGRRGDRRQRCRTRNPQREGGGKEEGGQEGDGNEGGGKEGGGKGRTADSD